MSRTITGVVFSDKGDKTIVIRTAMTKTHPIYKKQYKRNRKFMAHDESNEAKVGDMVIIRECRPLSANKRFKLEKIIEKATAGYQEADADSGVVRPEVEKQENKPKAAPAEDKKKATKAEPKEAKS